MGAGPVVTVGFLDENGEWVAVSDTNPLPVRVVPDEPTP